MAIGTFADGPWQGHCLESSVEVLGVYDGGRPRAEMEADKVPSLSQPTTVPEARKKPRAAFAGSGLEVLAEVVGFEPTVPFGTTVFKTAPLSHSGTPPCRGLRLRSGRFRSSTGKHTTSNIVTAFATIPYAFDGRLLRGYASCTTR